MQLYPIRTNSSIVFDAKRNISSSPLLKNVALGAKNAPICDSDKTTKGNFCDSVSTNAVLPEKGGPTKIIARGCGDVSFGRERIRILSFTKTSRFGIADCAICMYYKLPQTKSPLKTLLIT